MRRPTLFVALALVALTVRPSQTQAPAAPAPATPAAPVPEANRINLGTDANGNSLRRALRTGHISNYDESKVTPYTLPDPLVMASGRRVADANTWRRQRRPELIRVYESQIYGRVPANAPRITWEVAETDTHARDGAAILKKVVGHVGTRPDGPRIRVSVYTPSQAVKKVPIILLVTFGGGPAPAAAAGRGGPGAAATGEPPNAADILARGWGYATVGYNDIQPDRADAWTEGVIGQTLAPGQTKPTLGDWGTISAWAWGASRIADYLQSDPNVDGSHIALYGFSRLGKTVLWAAAQDQRFAAVIACCSGKIGAGLMRRNFGASISGADGGGADYWVAPNFKQFYDNEDALPMDGHMLLALIAPRPVLLQTGRYDNAGDPKGEFLAEVAAGPVYRLLGKQDLGTAAWPPAKPILNDLGYTMNQGGHGMAPGDWDIYLRFLTTHLQPAN